MVATSRFLLEKKEEKRKEEWSGEMRIVDTEIVESSQRSFHDMNSDNPTWEMNRINHDTFIKRSRRLNFAKLSPQISSAPSRRRHLHLFKNSFNSEHLFGDESILERQKCFFLFYHRDDSICLRNNNKGKKIFGQ